MSVFNVNIYIKNKIFITQRVTFRFLPNLQRLCEGLEETEINSLSNKYFIFDIYIYIYIYIY